MQAPINATDKRYIRRRQLGRFALIVLNVIAWLIIMFPLIYAFLMAIKPSGELYDPNSVLFPQNPTLTNFVDVFDIAPIGRYIMNSLIVAVSITLLQITTSILAAFAFRFLNFKGKGIIYGLILSTMMIPGEAVIISQF